MFLYCRISFDAVSDFHTVIRVPYRVHNLPVKHVSL